MEIRKVVFKQSGRVELQTAEFEMEPVGAHEVIVKSGYSLVSAGTELACLLGSEGWFPLPGTPGYVAVGEVVKAGSEVTKVKEGDTVFTYGPHAAYFKIDTMNRFGGMCIKTPEKAELDLMPFTRMATIAMTSIRVSEIELGDCVVVTGLGVVGNLASQLAKLQGATVIGVDVKRCQQAKACGIEWTVNSGDSDWKDKVKQISGARGISTLIDATGLSSVVTDACDVVAPYGEVILLGSPRAGFTTNATQIYNRIHLPGFTNFKGALEWRYPSFKNEFVKHSMERNSEIAMELIVDGRLILKPLYTHKLKPENAAEAYAGLKEKKGEYIGVVFDWTV